MGEWGGVGGRYNGIGGLAMRSVSAFNFHRQQVGKLKSTFTVFTLDYIFQMVLFIQVDLVPLAVGFKASTTLPSAPSMLHQYME